MPRRTTPYGRFRPEIRVQGDPKFYSPQGRLDYPEEAISYAESLAYRWSIARGWRVVDLETGAVVAEGKAT